MRRWVALFVLAILSGRAARAANPRTELLRATVKVDGDLRAADATVRLPPRTLAASAKSETKHYGSAWTCRASAQRLLSNLRKQSIRLVLDSVGKRSLSWGRVGRVSYHYFAVDKVARPTLLVDPTASSNFAPDAAPGGLLHELLTSAARDRGQPSVGRALASRVARGEGRALILTRPIEIDVYREALARAATLMAQLSRETR